MFTHLKKLIIIASLMPIAGLYAPIQLPINRQNKQETVPLELIIKDIDDYLKANKPVVASTRIEAAEQELKRIDVYISKKIKDIFTKYIKQQKNVIKVQKEYQIKKYGKLLEVN